MGKKQQLQQRFREVEERGKALIAGIEAAARPMTVAERAKLAAINNELDQIQRELDEIIATERSDSPEALARFRDLQARSGDPDDPFAPQRAGGTTQGGMRQFHPLLHRGERPTFARLFGAASRDTAGFRDFAEFAAVLRSGRYDPRLDSLSQRALQAGLDSQGGFLLPPAFQPAVWDSALEDEVIRPLAQVFPTDRSEITVPAFDDLDRSDGSTYGGWTATWQGELTTATRQTPKTRQITLKPWKCALYTQASSEFMADVRDSASMLATRLAKAVAYQLDREFFDGSGAGRPLGILNAPSLIVVDAEANQPAATIKYENLIAMEGRVAPGLDDGAVWVAHPSTRPELRRVVVVVGTGGSVVQALTESNGQLRLLGRPIKFSEKLQPLGSRGDILLCNPSQYLIALRSEIAVASTNAASWLEDALDFRAIIRADGGDSWNKPLSPPNGAPTLSWCVTLAARA